jgi:ribosomal protein S18 acetylase RimI-like enzyme
MASIDSIVLRDSIILRDSVILREFGEEDFDSLAGLWTLTGIGNPARGDDLECIRRSLECRGSLLVIACKSDIIGSLWLTDDGRRLYIHHMAVHPDWRRQGLARRLMETARAEAGARRLQMKLEVHRDNAGAIALYRAFGFETLGEHEVMIRREI